MSEIASEFKVHPAQVSQWEQRLVERTVESATGFIHFAMIRIMVSRLAEVER